MPVRETSKITVEKLKEKPKTQKVFEAILELGPTHNNRILEFLNQKESFKPRGQRRYWQINQVCGRVHDLVNKDCVVRDLGPHKGRWHGQPKTYHLWAVIGENQKPAGWTPIPKENLPKPIKRLAKIRAVDVRLKHGVKSLSTVKAEQALLFSKI